MTAFFVTLIICFSYFVQSTFGFGAGLIAIPFLSLLVDPKDAVTIVMVFSTICGLLVIKLWKDLDWTGIRRLMPGLVIGLFLGLALFSVIDRRFLGLVLALYIISYVILDFTRPRSLQLVTAAMPVKLQALVSGLAGGIVQGVMGTGGPMLVTYLKSHTSSIAQFRATVIGIFFIANMMRVVVMGAQDLIQPRIVTYCLIATPFFALAVYVGNKLPGRFDRKTFSLVINVLLLLSAVSVLVKQFT